MSYEPELVRGISGEYVLSPSTLVNNRARVFTDRRSRLLAPMARLFPSADNKPLLNAIRHTRRSDSASATSLTSLTRSRYPDSECYSARHIARSRDVPPPRRSGGRVLQPPASSPTTDTPPHDGGLVLLHEQPVPLPQLPYLGGLGSRLTRLEAPVDMGTVELFSAASSGDQRSRPSPTRSSLRARDSSRRAQLRHGTRTGMALARFHPV